MRIWKKATTTGDAVFLYLHDHPGLYFSPEHLATQVGAGQRHVRQVLKTLERLGKASMIEVVVSVHWGRPRRYYCATRATEDSLKQLEAFAEPVKTPGLLVALNRLRRRHA